MRLTSMRNMARSSNNQHINIDHNSAPGFKEHMAMKPEQVVHVIMTLQMVVICQQQGFKEHVRELGQNIRFAM